PVRPWRPGVEGAGAMNPPDILAAGVFGLVALLWLTLALVASLGLRSMPRLPDTPPDAPPDTPPAEVSIVFAARDEEGRVEQTVRRALAQRGAEVEVIAVDDRSTDGTPAALARLA